MLERIRNMSEDVPVLMLTALGTERDKVRGLNVERTITSPSLSARRSSWLGWKPSPGADPYGATR